MITIKNYKIIREIYSSANSLVYRAIRELDEKPVIIKMLREDYPTPEELLRYQQEYEITKNLNIEGVIKVYGLEKYHNTLIMFVEDFGAESVINLLETRKLTLIEIMELAIKSIEILGKIHEKNVIHKDINPSNIVYNLKNKQLKIIDFSISTVLSQEKTTWKNPDFLEGTLAYISPEQTGRMNRDVDYRTDFYSFGVTLYQLLTKKLPFKTEDVLDLVHSHLAKQPLSPDKINPKISAIISKIVLKLLAKIPEERYQSAWGIKADLEKALRQYKLGKKNIFQLGIKDQSSKFKICQKLYGREEEINTLLKAFDKITLGLPQLMLVSGYSGIGKSVLVQEIYPKITAKKGYFVRGKFDQYQRNIPYSAVILALRELVKQLFTENTIKLKEWQEKIQQALGVNAQIIIDLIPELELIIGKQESVTELPANEAQNRFNLVWQNFINVFCQKAHPLVLFLDDLQWVDMATLKLLELIMTGSNNQYLFVIGAYRDNEVDQTHPLMMTLAEIKAQSANISYIYLSSLGLNQVNQLIADSLNLPNTQTQLLAELVLEKTQGNPFFMKEFLQSLYEEKLLYFAYNQGWSWDINRIKARDFTDNVVSFLVNKLQNLPEKTQNILRLAACIGNKFDTKILMLIAKNSQKEIAKNLLSAVNQGFIMPTSNDYRFLIQDLIEINADIKAEYKFVHDRIQQAAYCLIPDSEKAITHLQIGKLLLGNLSPSEKEEKYFDIVNHLNQGIELVNTESDRYKLAELNLIAGKKAKESAAYQAGFNYLQIALKLLPNNCWQNDYELTLELYKIGTELSYLFTDFAQMNKFAEIVLQQGKIVLDKVKVYQVKIQAFIAQHQLSTAINTALEVLQLLGIYFPANPTQEDIQQAFRETDVMLTGKNITDLIDLPPMNDPEKIAAIFILAVIISPSYSAFPQLLPLIVIKQVQLSIQYGNGSISPVSYSSYGFILCGVIGDIDTGYEWGQLALNLLNKLNVKEFKAKTWNMVHLLINHWKNHTKNTLPYLLEGYHSGLETGDLEYAMIIIHGYCYNSYLIGKQLNQVEKEINLYTDSIKNFKNDLVITWQKMWHQTVLNLLGQGEDLCQLIGTSFNVKTMLSVLQSAKSGAGLYVLYCNQLMLSYLFREYKLAVQNAIEAEKYLINVTSLSTIPLFYFYDALTQLAIYNQVDTFQQELILERVQSHQIKMRKWADYAPMNYLHKFYLVAAEKARVMGENMSAMELYDKAIALAKQNEYLHEEALGYELAAKFYLSQDKKLIARAYMQEARYCYIHWGATAKVNDLELKYPNLMPKKSTLRLTDSTQITSNTYNHDILDLRTLIKALQTISSEIVFDKLLHKLINIIMENAGGEVGLLLEKIENKWIIKSALNCHDYLINNPWADFPKTIINYVNKTKENVVIFDNLLQHQFSNDEYIQKYKPKSILCMPMLYQGQLISIIYLENNLTTNVFTSERLEVVKILCYQGAIALENARFYALKEEYAHTLEQKVAERTAELAQANQELYRLATLDGLTQVANRRRFDEYLQQEWRVMFREKQSLSLILCDVDYFKKYNDHYGHQGGDECLKLVAKALSKAVERPADLVARYGGEEFVIILPNTDMEGAINVAEKIRSAIQKLQIIHAKSDVNQYVTLSLGIACIIPSLDTTPEILIHQADLALYEAKKQGRDRFCIYN